MFFFKKNKKKLQIFAKILSFLFKYVYLHPKTEKEI
jgi:hypothetical protein